MKRCLPIFSGILLFTLILCGNTAAQNSVGIGTKTPSASAAFEILSEDKGLLIPRLKASQRLGIVRPANGLMVYDLDSSSLFICEQSEWKRVKHISSLRELITGFVNGDMLVWNGEDWMIRSRSQLFTYVYRDADGDGFGDKFRPVAGTLPFPGFVADSTDCDDTNSNTYKNAIEICDGKDNDCDGLIDESPLNVPDFPDDTFTDQNGDGIDGTACAAVFVAVSGNDNNPGTATQPVATINAGLAKALAQGKTAVYVSSGTYIGKVAMINGISVYGGYNAANGWSRSASNITTILSDVENAGRVSAVEAINAREPGTTLDRFHITTGNVTTSSVNNYAVFVVSSPGLIMKNLVINAGRAGNGTGGTSGTTGANGSAGLQGQEGSCGTTCTLTNGGNAGAAPTCTGGLSTAGGRGGNGGQPGGGGSNIGFTGFNAGQLAPGFGNGGAGGGTGGLAGQNGQNGVPGVSGANGTGGVGGTLTSGIWTSATGTTGTAGTNGGGGGGGGGSGGGNTGFGVTCGNAGGGGGSGGCGGTGGTGGSGGGASFGVVIRNSSGIILTNNTIVSGRGGDGGNGGNGGGASTGGTGANGGAFFCVGGSGGRGGNGGNGGAGGSGGGGAGGPSYSVVVIGTTLSLPGTNSLVAGIGGTGGVGGNNGGNGASGIVLNF